MTKAYLTPQTSTLDRTIGLFGRVDDAKSLDCLRVPTTFDDDLDAYKEWQHFNVFDSKSGLFALLNFAIIGNPFDRNTACVRIGLFRTAANEIRGSIEPELADNLKVSYLDPGLAFPGVSVTYRDRCYFVKCIIEHAAAEVDLSFAIASTPLTTLTKPFGSGFLGWTVFPRMTANGTIRLGGKRYAIKNAAAYHDHDWGRFNWGEDFGWHWGIFLEDRASGLTLLFDQSTRGLGTPAMRSSLLVYQGERLVADCSGHDLDVEFTDVFDKAPIVLPGVLRATHGRPSCRVPKVVTLTGRDLAKQQMVVTFTADTVVQFIAPHHRGPGETQLNQVLGNIDVWHSIKDLPSPRSMRGYMEFAGPVK